MRMLIVAIVLLCAGVCHAGDTLVSTTIEPNRLKRCRQDFSTNLCRNHPNQYKCMMFRKGNRPYLTWEELFGDGLAKVALQKINRRNTIVWRNHCLAMPFDFKTVVPPLPRFDDRYQGKVVVVDLRQLAWAAYQQGRLVMWGTANGGSKICKETGKPGCKTSVGIFSVLHIAGAGKKSDQYPIDCVDKKKCGHPMPYFMKFKSSGEGLHGNKWLVGRNASHGCIRISVDDARFLGKEFAFIGMPIIISEY